MLLEGGVERARVEGIDRDRLAALLADASAEVDLDGLPERRPGCASITRDPTVADRLAAARARAEGRIRSRTLEVGELEDVFEALHDRGVTDGLPVVPPTPERVARMLGATGRDAQEVVGVLGPYDGEATVEKVAINAVMAGCPPQALPVVLAAVEAACAEEFAMHGLLATTYPAGPTVVVSGPLAERIGMNSAATPSGRATAPTSRSAARSSSRSATSAAASPARRIAPPTARPARSGPASPSGSRTRRGSRCPRSAASPRVRPV